MSVRHFWVDDEDDGCMSCGEQDYAESITDGLCVECNPTDPRHQLPAFALPLIEDEGFVGFE